MGRAQPTNLVVPEPATRVITLFEPAQVVGGPAARVGEVVEWRRDLLDEGGVTGIFC